MAKNAPRRGRQKKSKKLAAVLRRSRSLSLDLLVTKYPSEMQSLGISAGNPDQFFRRRFGLSMRDVSIRAWAAFLQTVRIDDLPAHAQSPCPKPKAKPFVAGAYKLFPAASSSALPTPFHPTPRRVAVVPPGPATPEERGGSEAIVVDNMGLYPEVARLRAEMRRLVTDYPPGVERIPPGPPIGGNGFFPGANGLYIDQSGTAPSMPVGKIMILGHNYDVRRNYDACLEAGGENERKVATWRTLLTKVFPRIGVDPRDCFYTNFYMGLMSDFRDDGTRVRNTDPFPGADCQWFVEMCVRFFVEQVRIIQPRLVVVLGKYTPCKVTGAFVRSDFWKDLTTFREIDAAGCGVLRAVEIVGTGLAPTFVSVVHPCRRGPNVRWRRYQGKEGDVAEIQMLRDALRFSGMAP